MTTNDIYSNITNKIIADLEKGELTWRKPWSDANLSENVMRPLQWDGTPYKGINTIMLWATAAENGFTSPYWMTYHQAVELKAHVRKEQKSLVRTVKVLKRDSEEPGSEDESEDNKTRQFTYLKQYAVFNACQIEGLSEHYYKLPERVIENPEQHMEAIDRFFAMTKADLKIGNKAAYFITSDHIEMPPFECFDSAARYYETLAHETTHWTRHPSRLNRDFNRKQWGDEGYAKEELVAELGSCFLAADLGLAPIIKDDHAAYIQSWLKVLKNDKRFIFFAASYAQKAVEYLHAMQSQDTFNPSRAMVIPQPQI